MLEAAYGGYLVTHSDQPSPQKLTAGLGSVWETRNVGYKPYAAVTSIHTALDGLAQIMRDNGLRAADIASVDAGLSQATYIHCAWEYKAQGVTAAQMNLYYGMAMVALDGTAFVDQYREERLSDPEVLALIPRISARIDPEIEAMGAAYRHGSRVTVTTREGRIFKVEILNRRGSAENPLAPEDIDYKFRQVVKSCLDPDRVERVIELVRSVDRLADVGELIAIMAAARPQ